MIQNEKTPARATAENAVFPGRGMSVSGPGTTLFSLKKPYMVHERAYFCYDRLSIILCQVFSENQLLQRSLAQDFVLPSTGPIYVNGQIF